MARRTKIATRKQKPQQSEDGLMVNVPDGQFEKSFRRFRNKIQESGLLLELRDRMEYEKPSIKKKKAKNQARRRWLKKIENSQLPEKVY